MRAARRRAHPEPPGARRPRRSSEISVRDSPGGSTTRSRLVVTVTPVVADPRRSRTTSGLRETLRSVTVPVAGRPRGDERAERRDGRVGDELDARRRPRGRRAGAGAADAAPRRRDERAAQRACVEIRTGVREERGGAGDHGGGRARAADRPVARGAALAAARHRGDEPDARCGELGPRAAVEGEAGARERTRRRGARGSRRTRPRRRRARRARRPRAPRAPRRRSRWGRRRSAPRRARRRRASPRGSARRRGRRGRPPRRARAPPRASSARWAAAPPSRRRGCSPSSSNSGSSALPSVTATTCRRGSAATGAVTTPVGGTAPPSGVSPEAKHAEPGAQEDVHGRAPRRESDAATPSAAGAPAGSGDAAVARAGGAVVPRGRDDEGVERQRRRGCRRERRVREGGERLDDADERDPHRVVGVAVARSGRRPPRARRAPGPCARTRTRRRPRRAASRRRGSEGPIAPGATPWIPAGPRTPTISPASSVPCRSGRPGWVGFCSAAGVASRARPCRGPAAGAPAGTGAGCRRRCRAGRS